MGPLPRHDEHPVARVVLLVLCVGFTALMGYFTIPDYAPAIRAVRGSGQPGTFVAERLDCSKRCLWYGTFRPDTGGTARHNVWLEGADRNSLTVARSTRALDTGARHYVYTPAGNPNWLGLIGGSLLCLLGTVSGIQLLWTTVRHHRRPPRPKRHPRQQK